MSRISSRIGYLQLSLAQVCLGINIILGKILTSTYPFLQLLALRFLIGFIIIAFWLCYRFSTQDYEEIKGLPKRAWIILFLQALCGGFLFNLLTLYGLQYATATVTGIVHSTLPAFVAFFSYIILNETLTSRKIFSILLTVIGILLLTVDNITILSDPTGLLGLCVVFLAIIPGALFIVFSKMMVRSLQPFTTTALINLFNAVLFFMLVFNQQWTVFFNASLIEWGRILLYSGSGSVLFFIFWYKGLARTTASTAALFIGIMPISTSVLAYFFLEEMISWCEILGMLCVLLSIYVGALQTASNREP